MSDKMPPPKVHNYKSKKTVKPVDEKPELQNKKPLNPNIADIPAPSSDSKKNGKHLPPPKMKSALDAAKNVANAILKKK